MFFSWFFVDLEKIQKFWKIKDRHQNLILYWFWVEKSSASKMNILTPPEVVENPFLIFNRVFHYDWKWILKIWRMGNRGRVILRKVSVSSSYRIRRSLRMHGFRFCFWPAFRPSASLPVAQLLTSWSRWLTHSMHPWPGENSTSFW